MNKDMDGRILPNGQYRDGQNIQISRSEGDDEGALENVLGNNFLNNFGLTDESLEIIGYLTVDTSDSIFLFITNYTDSSPNTLNNNASGIAGSHYIVQYNVLSNAFNILVQGSFLNFSLTHPIIGINLLEDLLFWTDNRNQPRKINITKAVGDYYNNEDKISVSKYYPFEPISLLEKDNVDLDAGFQSSMKDKVSEYLPIHAAAKVSSVNGNVLTLIGIYTNIKPGAVGDRMTGQAVGSDVTVNLVAFSPGFTEITLNGDVGDVDVEDIVYFQRKNPFFNNNWTGDKQFLKDKFARFSYRFKYVDGEYSLSAPFTQIAFVPEQDGYFIGKNAMVSNSDPAGEGGLVGDEGNTINSTVVGFMQNKINDIGLYIPAPTLGNSFNKTNWSKVSEELHVVEVDILYKEAQSNKTTIVDTITSDQFSQTTDSYYYYNYQSRKPWKTLPPSQTTRVSESIPIRAFAQEVSGNRVMYANYIDKHTSPINLNYSVNINQKPNLPTSQASPNYNNRDYYVKKEYQNHTLKGNRTYQAGIVLYDRYGRQSNVILSSIIDINIPDYAGSTFFHPYRKKEDYILLDKYPTDAFGNPPVPPPFGSITWPGDQINLIFYNSIPKFKTEDGYPGIYSEADGTVDSLILVNDTITPVPGVFQPPCTITGVPFVGKSAEFSGTCNVEFNAAGQVVSIIVTSSTDTWTNNQSFVLDFCSLPITFGCDVCATGGIISGLVQTTISNPLGWYSYKVVIKQTEQEYYNVYLPTTLAGYPCDVDGIPAQSGDPDAATPTLSSPQIPDFTYPKGQSGITSHIVLYGDNINKVARDLQEVGPTQEKYRSSVNLFGRVNNLLKNNGQTKFSVSNEGYDPGENPDIAVQIATMENLGLGDLRTSPSVPIIPNIFYKGETNPQIARVETNKQFGVAYNNCTPNPAFSIPVTNPDDIVPPNTNSQPWGTTLSVYETAPVESLLDIFWETTTSGLISDLNFKIENVDNTVPIGITDPQINWSEDNRWGDQISGTFEAAGVGGQGLGSACSIVLNSVVRGDGQPENQIIMVETGPGSGEYYLEIDPALEASFSPLFLSWENDLKNVFYFNFTITRDNGVDPVTSIDIQVEGNVQNANPVRKDNVIPTQVLLPNGSYEENQASPVPYTNQTLLQIKTNMNARWDDPALPVEDIPKSTIMFMPQLGGWVNEGTFNGTNPVVDFSCQTVNEQQNSATTRIGFGKIIAAQPQLANGTTGALIGYNNAKWNATFGYEIDPTLNKFVLGAPYVSTNGVIGSQFFGPPAGTYNSLVGFVPNPWVQFGVDFAEDYPNGRDGNMNIWANAPSNGGMNCCDEPFPDLNPSPQFTPGWQRFGTGIHDGLFAAYNGVYGSEAGTSFPPGFRRSDELVFSISRMYQVSTWVNMWGMNQSIFDFPSQSFSANAERSSWEYIFGLNPFINNYQLSVDLGGGDIYPRNQNISTIQSPLAFAFGPDIPSWAADTGAFPSPGSPGSTWCTQYEQDPPIDGSECLPLFQLPTSPIYWDHESGGRPGSQGASQSIFSQGGESYVGERYNNGRWYWADLEALSQQIFDKWSATNGWTSYNQMMRELFPIQNGSNTFYSAWQGYYNGPLAAGQLANPAGGDGRLPADSAFWTNNILTDKGFTGYIGSLDPATGIGNAFNKRFRFNAKTEDNFLLAASGYSQPLRGWIEAGDTSIPKQAWDVFQNGASDWLQGNGMPGGRYVVTLRATDRSTKAPAGQETIPNPEGLYVEWDIPVIVPESNIPFGRGMDCRFVNSGGFAPGFRWQGFFSI
jgi:hypothetical protein